MYTQSVPALISKNVGNALTNYKTWGGIIVNVKEYGAKGDGIADDTSAIQDAINAAVVSTNEINLVYFPAGVYRVSGLVNNSRVAITGTDPQNTKIVCTTANAPVIQYNNDLSFVYLANLTLDREVTATSGGDGIYSNASGTGFFFNNLHVKNQYVGINLTGVIAGAYCTEIFTTDNVSDGVQVSFPNMKFDNVYSQRNGGNGFNFSRYSSGLYLTNCEAYKNLGHGFLVISSQGGSESFNDVYLLQCIAGSNAKNGFYIDTNGQNINISNCFSEYAGFYDEGVNIAPGTWNGITITASNNRVDLNNNVMIWSSGSGAQISADGTKINGGIYALNSLQTSGTAAGISIMDNTKRVNISGVSACKYEKDGGATQSFGVSLFPGVSDFLISNCDVSGNVTGPIYIDASVGTGKINDCLGFNPKGAINPQPTVPASGVAFENTYSVTCEVHIFGGTVTYIGKGSTGISGMNFGTLTLEPGESVVIVYSAVPYWTWFGL